MHMASMIDGVAVGLFIDGWVRMILENRNVQAHTQGQGQAQTQIYEQVHGLGQGHVQGVRGEGVKMQGHVQGHTQIQGYGYGQRYGQEKA